MSLSTDHPMTGETEGSEKPICIDCEQPLDWIYNLQLIAQQCPERHNIQSFYDEAALLDVIDDCAICSKRLEMPTDSFRYCHECFSCNFYNSAYNPMYACNQCNYVALCDVLDTFPWSTIEEILKGCKDPKNRKIIGTRSFRDAADFRVRIGRTVRKNLSINDLLDEIVSGLELDPFELGKKLNLSLYHIQLDPKDEITVTCHACSDEIDVYFKDFAESDEWLCEDCISEKDRAPDQVQAPSC